MLRKVCDVLMDVYGYSVKDSVTSPLRDKHDIILSSGRVNVMLIDHPEARAVRMRIVEDALEYSELIRYDSEDYKQVILNVLLTFAMSRSLAELL